MLLPTCTFFPYKCDNIVHYGIQSILLRQNCTVSGDRHIMWGGDICKTQKIYINTWICHAKKQPEV